MESVEKIAKRKCLVGGAKEEPRTKRREYLGEGPKTGNTRKQGSTSS